MESQQFVVDSEGGILTHDSDFSAVENNLSLECFLTKRAWRWVKSALLRTIGTGEPEVVLCCTAEKTRGIWELRLVPEDGIVRVTAQLVTEVTRDLVERMMQQTDEEEYHTLTLITPDGAIESAYEAESAAEAIAWVGSWLDDPMGMAPAVFPPGVAPPKLRVVG